MLKAILSDFSRTVCFPAHNLETKSLNAFYKEVKDQPGFHFFDYFSLNSELLKTYTALKPKLGIYLFTTGYLQNDPDCLAVIKPIFQEIWNVESIGFTKTDPQAFVAISQKLNVEPSEILFIDDEKLNLEAAKQAGLQTMTFASNQESIPALKTLLAA
jgi:FMN phosphatase YigB (HAD superfamily)